jgi:two-component system, sensor histidine kinase and response regulator
VSSPPPENEAVRRLHAEYATARALAESASLREAAPRVLAAVCENLGWEHGALWRLDPPAGVLRCVEVWHPAFLAFPNFEAASRGTTFAPGVGLPGRVWQTRRPAWIKDLAADPNFPRAEVAAREGLHGALGFPILLGDEVLGVLEFFSRVVRDPDDELQEMLATVGSQLGQFAERKRAEGELATFFQMSRDMMLIAGFDGTFRRVNPAWETTLGYASEELVSRRYLDFIHPDDREATKHEAASLASGSSLVFFENRYRHKDGSYRWLSWSATPVPEEGLIYATARDVTEQRRVAAELEKARTDADAANRAKSDFLANMSHEIRTPMNAVLGMAELLLDTRLSAEQREYVATLKDSAESLLELLNDVLDFSKIEAGALELHPVEFDVRETVGDTLRTLGVRAHQKGLEIAARIAPDVPERLLGDATRLRQVIVNLVGNAIKFTERGEVLVQIEKEREADGEAVLRFLVADTGIGIARAKQKVVFDAFTQADSSITRRYGGTGLGLAISAQLVAMMGGRISLESESGRGSRFRFTLAFPLAPPRPASEPAKLGGLRVLVVDDNATNRRILVEMLRHWRLRPVAVAGGRAAIREMEKAQRAGRPFPLVLLDANMPEMDGFALAGHIKRHPRLVGGSIMMLTSGGRPGDRARCLELGVSTYLTKPIKQSDLLDAIVGVLSAGAPSPSPSSRAAARKKPGGRRLSVLVAEDNVVNQRVAAGLLEQAGHTVAIAANGREAVDATLKQPFDLVLMDVQMPEMDGLEATAAIRERERQKGGHLPIVAVTAHAMKGDAERCLAAGMDAYVPKPLQPRELFATIESLVSGPRPAKTSEGPGAAAPSAAPAPAAPEAPVVDERRLLERVGGDRKALRGLVRVFLADAPLQRERIHRALRKGDARGVQAAAHALKGAVSNFAAPTATDAALRLQKLGEGGNLAEGAALLSRLDEELERVRRALAAMTGSRAPAKPRRPPTPSTARRSGRNPKKKRSA